MFETRSQAWKEVGLLRQISPRVVKRARLEALLLVPLFVAVVVLYDNRVQLLGDRRHPPPRGGVELEPPLESLVTVVTVIALMILGWAIARDIGRSFGPALFRRLEPATAGTFGFLIRLLTAGGGAVRGPARRRHPGPHARARRSVHGGDLRPRGAADARQPDRGHGAAERAPVPRGRARAPAGRQRSPGQIEGTVSSLGLLYTTFATGDDLIMVPNSVVLNVAVLPLREPEAVNLRARLRAGHDAGDLQEMLERSLETPLRDAPRITLEELDGEEVVVRIAATPRVATRGRRLASELL